jgi:hypothetical protein
LASPPTFDQVIKAVHAALHDGDDRIAESPHAFRGTWWPSEPTLQQQLLSDHGVPSPLPEIEEQFREEVAAIRESLNAFQVDPGLADWQKGGSEPGRLMMRSLNIQGMALDLWEQIALPVRRFGAVVVRIRAPGDVMGSPILHALPIDEYIRGVSAKTSDDVAQVEALQRRVEQWRTAAVLLGIVVAGAVAIRFL